MKKLLFAAFMSPALLAAPIAPALVAITELVAITSPAHAVVPTCTGNITSVYWVVTDTNQSTQVYDPNRGYVANTDATYATWLAGIGACPVSGGNFTSAVNSGGLVQFPVASGANMVTGQVWQVYGTDGGVYDGKWTVTVSGNNVTLQGSTYTVGVTGGAFYGPQVTPTNAGLMANVNQTNEQNFLTTNLGYNPPSINSGAHLVLTNPLVENQAYSGTGDAGSPCHMNVDLPQMNLVGSYPIGHPINFSNFNTLNSATACNLRVYASDGTTLKTTIQPGQTSSLVVTSNLTPGGTETTLPPTLSLAYLLGINIPPGSGAILTTGNGGALVSLVPGTGVATALGVNVGSAGAVVVNGGALGSPSSAGTLPAHTLGGTVSGGGNNVNNVIIGAVTPLAGSFTTITASTSLTSPLLIGGSGTTGAQQTFQTTTGVGTTERFAFNGGNNGATPFATLSASGGFYVIPAGAGLSLSNNAGTAFTAVNSGGSGHYLIFNNPTGSNIFQGGDTSDPTSYYDNTTHQFTNLANNANWVKINSTGLYDQIIASSATTSAVCVTTGTGLLSYDGTIGTCNLSDERFKHFEGHLTGALDQLVALSRDEHFGYFQWTDSQYGTGRKIGAGAQTVARYFPELTATGSDGHMSLAYDKLTVPIIDALAELKVANDNLQASNDNLRACMESWKCRLFGWK
jgi:hypothetical protein